MSPPFLQLTASDMWIDLSAWMQRREMIDYCRLNYDVDKETAKDLIKLIDVAIRNRIRGLLQSVEQENLPAIQLPTGLIDVDFEPSRRRQRCPKCFHVNRVMWCRCACHQQPSASGPILPP